MNTNPMTPPSAGGVAGVLEVLREHAALEGDDHSVGLCNCDIRAAIRTVEAMAGALHWYAEQVAGCRKLGSNGEPFRYALDADGGQRATSTLAAIGSAAPAGDGVVAHEKDKVRALSEWLHIERPEAERALWTSDLVRIVRLVMQTTGLPLEQPATPAGGGDLPERLDAMAEVHERDAKEADTTFWRRAMNSEAALMREAANELRRLASTGSAPSAWKSPFGPCVCDGEDACPGCNPNQAISLARELATNEERMKHPPCVECGATSPQDAQGKCICGGDKDDCHGCQLWPDGAAAPTQEPPR